MTLASILLWALLSAPQTYEQALASAHETDACYIERVWGGWTVVQACDTPDGIDFVSHCQAGHYDFTNDVSVCE